LREGSGEGLLSTEKAFRDKASKRPTARSRELRCNATDAERRLWARLSARQVAGTRFNRQFPIGPFVCDFVSRTARLVIEVDGGQHANQEAADRVRSGYLRAQGYHVVRFWNNEVLENIEGVVETIERILRTSPPLPPPTSGRGIP
jgi:very-short-patch-repair endonuclease